MIPDRISRYRFKPPSLEERTRCEGDPDLWSIFKAAFRFAIDHRKDRFEFHAGGSYYAIVSNENGVSVRMIDGSYVECDRCDVTEVTVDSVLQACTTMAVRQVHAS